MLLKFTNILLAQYHWNTVNRFKYRFMVLQDREMSLNYENLVNDFFL